MLSWTGLNEDNMEAVIRRLCDFVLNIKGGKTAVCSLHQSSRRETFTGCRNERMLSFFSFFFSGDAVRFEQVQTDRLMDRRAGRPRKAELLIRRCRQLSLCSSGSPFKSCDFKEESERERGAAAAPVVAFTGHVSARRAEQQHERTKTTEEPRMEVSPNCYHNGAYFKKIHYTILLQTFSLHLEECPGDNIKSVYINL